MSTPLATDEKFTGHESFVCRYGWLRKAYDAVEANPHIFSDMEGAIVSLGVGSNMVKSLEFWARAFDIVAARGEGKHRAYQTTPFGRGILDHDAGADPFLEDPGTLWMLHWKLVTRANLAAWNLVFQELQESRVSHSRLIELLQRRGRRSGASLVEYTIKQHLDILLSTYTTQPTANFRALEESLGSPLQELGLLTRYEVEERTTRDPIVEMRIGPKPSLPPQTFLAAVIDHWSRTNPTSSSISLADIIFGKLGPGVVFKLDEASVINYLSSVADVSDRLSFQDGALIRAVQLKPKTKLEDLRRQMVFA